MHSHAFFVPFGFCIKEMSFRIHLGLQRLCALMYPFAQTSQASIGTGQDTRSLFPQRSQLKPKNPLLPSCALIQGVVLISGQG